MLHQVGVFIYWYMMHGTMKLKCVYRFFIDAVCFLFVKPPVCLWPTSLPCGTTLLSNLKHDRNIVPPHCIFLRRRHLLKRVVWKLEKYYKTVSLQPMLNLLLNNSGRIHPPRPVFHFLSKSWWNCHSMDISDISHTCGFGDGRNSSIPDFSIQYGDFERFLLQNMFWFFLQFFLETFLIRRKVSITKYVLIFSTILFWNISHSKKDSARYYQICKQVFNESTP